MQCRSGSHPWLSEGLCPRRLWYAPIYTLGGYVQCRSGKREDGRQHRERSAARHAEHAEPGSGRREQHEDPQGGSRHLRRRSRSRDRHRQPDWRDRGHPLEWDDRQACGPLTAGGAALQRAPLPCALLCCLHGQRQLLWDAALRLHQHATCCLSTAAAASPVAAGIGG